MTDKEAEKIIKDAFDNMPEDGMICAECDCEGGECNWFGKPDPDHEPVKVFGHDSQYGGLSLKREGGVDYWSSDNSDGEDWRECPDRIASEIRHHLKYSEFS